MTDVERPDENTDAEQHRAADTADLLALGLTEDQITETHGLPLGAFGNAQGEQPMGKTFMASQLSLDWRQTDPNSDAVHITIREAKITQILTRAGIIGDHNPYDTGIDLTPVDIDQLPTHPYGMFGADYLPRRSYKTSLSSLMMARLRAQQRDAVVAERLAVFSLEEPLSDQTPVYFNTDTLGSESAQVLSPATREALLARASMEPMFEKPQVETPASIDELAYYDAFMRTRSRPAIDQ